jgi:uncharacterized SAM-binding protein YcdF (DUF218 family)
MPRAREAFEHAGFSVVPAPMGYSTPSHQPLILKLMPWAYAMDDTSTLMHEVIGRWWYRLRYY